LAVRVLVVGSINMDLIVRCPRLPGAGETLAGDDFATAPGGKGANQAVACSRLGARTAMIARVGGDEFGQRLRRGLQEEDVDVTHVRVDGEASTGVALILLERTGDNRIVVVLGANARLGDEEVATASQALAESDVLLMPLEVPLPVAKAVAAAARERAVLCVLDAGAATPTAVDIGLPGLVDVLSPNEAEAEILTGIPIKGRDDARRAADRLRDMGAKDVVVKLGRDGAYWSGPQGEAHVPAFRIDPVDTTAAGDAFTSCLAVSLAEGYGMVDAIRRANAAGALACLTLGAQPSMPTAGALEQFLRERI